MKHDIFLKTITNLLFNALQLLETVSKEGLKLPLLLGKRPSD